MTWLTTGEAARLIDAHQSSIKRWCDEDRLSCSVTKGGHRRIGLHELVAFAEGEDWPCRLISFGTQAEAVYEAAERARVSNDYSGLVDLMYAWLEETRPEAPGELFRFLDEQAFPVPDVCDRLISPLLYRMGRDWAAGVSDIGDEHRMYYLLLEAYQQLRAGRLERHRPGEDASLAIVGCGEGNYHEMGALMVRLCLELHEVRTVYLGAALPVEDIAVQQQKLGASIVCVSLPRPSISSDVERTLRILARSYHVDRPYELLVGGRSVDDVRNFDETVYPFAHTALLSSIRALHEWLKSPRQFTS